MSRIPDLGRNLEKLGDVLSEYDQTIQEVGSHLSTSGKTIEQCLKEQSVWPWYCDERKAEVETIMKYVEKRMDAVRGTLFRKFTENYSRDLSDRSKDKYIDNDPEFLSIHEVYLEVSELHTKFKELSEAFRVRGFALRDITTLRVHKLEQALL